MDKNLSKTMQELYEKYKNESNTENDIEFIGTILYNVETSTGKVDVTKDIFKITQKDKDGKIIVKYYLDDGSCIAGRGNDEKIYPSAEFAEEDISFISQFENSNNSKISLKEHKELEKAAKELGISIEDIRGITEIDLEQKVADKEDKDKEDEKLDLDNQNHQTTEQIKQNENTLEGISSKQELNMDRKIDDRYSLANVFGIESGCKLIVVNTDSIENSNNSTRFSCLIKHPDGRLEIPEMLSQTGGTYSDRNVYETNYDGSEVEKKVIYSSYKINSSLVPNAVINIRYGSMGYIEVNYGETDPTSKGVFSQKLETDHDFYHTTYAVRYEFSTKHGTYNSREKISEIENKGNPEQPMKLPDADGKKDTTTVSHLLELPVVTENIEKILNSLNVPLTSPTRNNILEIYLTTVKNYGDLNTVCNPDNVIAEVTQKIEELWPDISSGNVDPHEHDHDPVHKH